MVEDSRNSLTPFTPTILVACGSLKRGGAFSMFSIYLVLSPIFTFCVLARKRITNNVTCEGKQISKKYFFGVFFLLEPNQTCKISIQSQTIRIRHYSWSKKPDNIILFRLQSIKQQQFHNFVPTLS